MFNNRIKFTTIIFVLLIVVSSSRVHAVQNCPANTINPDILGTCTITYNSATRVMNFHPSVSSGSPATGLYFSLSGPGLSSTSGSLNFGYDFSTTVAAGSCGTYSCTLHYRYKPGSVCTIYNSGNPVAVETSCSDV